MEPATDVRDGKENDARSSAAQAPSPSCRRPSPAASDGSGGARKRPALAGQPDASPLADPVRKRHRPGSPLSTSTSPANERETSAEAAARRQLAALSSPSGRRPGGGTAQAQEPSSSPAAPQAAANAAAPPPPPPPPPPAYWWLERLLQPLKRDAPDADLDPFSLLAGHPLLALACEGQAALLAKVLDNGGDVDAQDGRGLTALHLASGHARLACVKVLLEAGARQLPDRQGCTPRQLAEQAGHSDVLGMMRQHEEVQAELQRQAHEQQQRPAEEGGAAGEEGT
ncbi:D Chain Coupling Of Remote Alternating-access Transport Mechanisms For Protons And Substrates In The Multidrug Efflux Pump Acrb [Chlorella sorokiniana]|uniref:D Chain Coupling Of Remote Alternating-access Transport Mechanisms For Protons And Substrates In The Multidrug Efflux Pump Acrb n=1 Tax=Chlorella sorokiniana TaxID=3076 RepID=A0A2P6U185_CHLSO|nr:D Chain Coupling Of Remote Alternating-access Transport Mechanisms For Protons And Substrates In The Multidrug Efflux Pump Acrb [Chlorella sorokiniana]|eukprot:PRW60077.1 D Chain Coupling Of Remote Alternating-access Transport Mechanisms For Protons And Substrates In The Multidrug Efflux Pump Acrb [Chlorella sorokiniana]